MEVPMDKRYNDTDSPSSWGFFWLKVLYGIPLLGFIMLIVHSCDSRHIAKRNHARSYWCGLLAAIFLFIVLTALICLLNTDAEFANVHSLEDFIEALGKVVDGFAKNVEKVIE